MNPITAYVVFDRIPVMGMLVGLDGTVLAANAATCRLLGRAAASIVGQPLSSFLTAPRPVLAREGQQEWSDELELSSPKGSLVVEVAVARLSTEQGEVLQMFGLDVTARKQSLGLVAGGVAHDFNNLLVGVLAEASATREDQSLPASTLESLRRIEHGARKMSQLTRSMLAYSGRGRVDTVRLDPDGLLREMQEGLGRQLRQGVALKLVPTAGPIAIEADATLIRQLIGNLVANASESKGTRVEVASKIIMRGNVEWWQLEVNDDGEGIDASALSRIFEPFYTTRPDQTGLGLSAVQGIVRRLGGDIEVDSTPGLGSRFRVRLPVLAGVEPPQRKLTSEGMTPVAKLAGLRVLIADDEPSVRSTVKRLLERRGASVVLANDGSEAEDKLGDGSYGLVILDVSMPGRTGYDVLATVRRQKPGLPVILMSGYTELKTGASGEEPDGFMEKPFTARALDALIDQVIAARRG